MDTVRRQIIPGVLIQTGPETTWLQVLNSQVQIENIAQVWELRDAFQELGAAMNRAEAERTRAEADAARAELAELRALSKPSVEKPKP